MSKANWKVFQDSVHGAIHMHPLIVRIIDTEVFQRLRHIKQLSMGYWVFPAASHNRFEHSIGVCHLARTMLTELEGNSDEELMLKINLTPEERLCVQIAGLCHDLGHGPFSHSWEAFLARRGKNWRHEEASMALFDMLLDESFPSGTVRDIFRSYGLQKEHEDLIKDLIMGDANPKPSNNNRAFLYEIVANKATDVDVDKWDYFLRDGQNLEFKFSFDFQRCQKFCKIVEREKGGPTTVAFRDKEAYNLSLMFQLRTHLFERAYRHRVCECLEIMVLDALELADPFIKVLGSDGKQYSLSEAHTDCQAFSRLTDHIYAQILFSTDENLELARRILKRISRRELYEKVGEWQLQPLPETESDDKGLTRKCLTQEDLTKMESELGERYACSQRCINNGKYIEPLEKVHFFSKYDLDGPVKPPSFPELATPKYTLSVFCRDKAITGHTSEKESIEKFLREKGVLKA